jgi:hypothetical protein
MFREPNLIPSEMDIDGLPIDYIFGDNKTSGHRLTNYRMTKKTIEQTAKKVGFDQNKIAWHELSLPQELQNEREDWNVFLNAPPVSMYSLTKPSR